MTIARTIALIWPSILIGAASMLLGACEDRAPADDTCSTPPPPAPPPEEKAPDWARGVENQRKADMGDGFYLNPIMAGDHPDPSILKDGEDYYMTFSSFDSYPGLAIWHSKDLVNWEPVGPALFKNVGSVWAPELIRHEGKFYIYLHARVPDYRSIYVITADDIKGPWSEPVDLMNPRIDPGHVVGEDGKRYLFLSAGDRVELADDGLSIVGEMAHVYDGWKYPAEWDVESFSQEGPKMLKRGDYYYMVLAEGGTAGPPTGHMVVAARSKSIHGPWENSPYNPIVRTQSAAEKWWSRGHATLIEGPDTRWYMMYHGYENGFMTLGRQTLMEPIEWTDDGWFRAVGQDVGKPIPKPQGGAVVPHGFAFSDDFSTSKMGTQWNFYNGGLEDNARVTFENSSLVLKAKGTSPKDTSPLTFVVGDQAYQVEVEMEFDPLAQAGMLLFYNKALYAGLGVNATQFVMHRYGQERNLAKPASITNRLFMRVTNNRHIVTIRYSVDGKAWEKFGTQMEVSGYHHNVAYDFLSLRPAIYASGEGEVRFRNFKYQALP